MLLEQRIVQLAEELGHKVRLLQGWGKGVWSLHCCHLQSGKIERLERDLEQERMYSAHLFEEVSLSVVSFSMPLFVMLSCY